VNSERPVSGRWLEDLEVGTRVHHPITRTVTESDNVLFTCLTMNPQPLHLDHEFAAASEFGRPLVNSLFTLGLLVGLTVHDLTLGTTIANLGFEAIEFPKPVFAGDTIHAETEVVASRSSQSRPEAGVVTFEHSAFNQRGELVARCRRNALMRRRPADA
jgi:acyl dehydratase